MFQAPGMMLDLQSQGTELRTHVTRDLLGISLTSIPKHPNSNALSSLCFSAPSQLTPPASIHHPPKLGASHSSQGLCSSSPPPPQQDQVLATLNPQDLLIWGLFTPSDSPSLARQIHFLWLLSQITQTGCMIGHSAL